MTPMQCSAESIGNPSVGDTVEMRVSAIKDGMATLEPMEKEAPEEENSEDNRSTINKMSDAFGPENETGEE